MALSAGTRIGPYEVVALIGVGGMGEVYRARDTKLNRDVALKLLPDAFARDSDRIVRFTREAQTLAALNHPHIAHIHGLEETDPSTGGRTAALVMEFVDGEDLAQRISRGAIPIDDALALATQILEALEAAHEHGIIHRDLKPANVRVRPDGTVKVLDFGLAKMVEQEAGAAASAAGAFGVSQSPTVLNASIAGTVVGTAPYMSPEQAKGRVVDRRTDIFAFGCVLFEMLSGRRAFDGDDAAEIVSRVLQREPDWTLLPADTPPRIRELIGLCLEKNPRSRRSAAADVRLDIEQALRPNTAAASVGPSTRAAIVPWIAAAVATLAAAALVILAFRRPTMSLPEMRLEISTPPTGAPMEFALSPDGMMLVFVALDGPQHRLWLRRLDSVVMRPLTGTDGADLPFWSADGRSIGFFSAGKLKRVDIAGGAPQVLADAPLPRGGTWNAAGTILFAPSSGPLYRIAASGGEASPVTEVSPGLTLHRFPQFLPDGRRFLFYAQGNPEVQGLFLGSLDDRSVHRLTPADGGAAWLPPDRMLYLAQGTLVARRVDVKNATVEGDPEIVADNVGGRSIVNLPGVAASSGGRIAYRAGFANRRQLTWFDRTGKAVGIAGEPDVEALRAPELAPDGRRVAVDRTVQGNRDVWLMDLGSGRLTRFTFDAAIDGFPVWSPDGTQIAFESTRKGSYDIYVKPASGIGTEQVVLERPGNQWPIAWSKDGRFLLFYDGANGADLWALPMTGSDRTPIAVATTPSAEPEGAFSPDGRWVAYETSESGQFQIVVQPFPTPASKWQVSIRGGQSPRWSADGRELYFLAPDGVLMAAAVRVSGDSFDAGTPVPLFQTRLRASGADSIAKAEYAVSSDGRFLINHPVEDATAAPITLILNWKPPAK